MVAFWKACMCVIFKTTEVHLSDHFEKQGTFQNTLKTYSKYPHKWNNRKNAPPWFSKSHICRLFKKPPFPKGRKLPRNIKEHVCVDRNKTPVAELEARKAYMMSTRYMDICFWENRKRLRQSWRPWKGCIMIETVRWEGKDACGRTGGHAQVPIIILYSN